jgi:hypothetical protein
LSFEISDGEPSAVLECGVLDADEFPAFFAPAVEVVLDVFDNWFDDAACGSGVYACFYGDDFVLPDGSDVGCRLEFAEVLGFVDVFC